MFLALRMALYGLFAALAGQGLEFITFDEVTGQVDITFNIESLTTIVLGAFGFAATFAASFWDRIRGPVKDEGGAVSVSSSLAVVLGLIALAGCMAPRPGDEPLSVEQRFFEAVATYEAAKAEAAAYVSSGPLCSSLDVVGCVPDRIVIAIDDITDRFDPQIEAAVTLFIGTSAISETNAQIKLDMARRALRALSQTLASAEADT